MTDIVDRLTYRAENLWAHTRPFAAMLDLEAAAEILRLREEHDCILDDMDDLRELLRLHDRAAEVSAAENKRLRAALEKIVSSHDCDYYNGNPADLADIARNALRERVFELESERAEDHSTT